LSDQVLSLGRTDRGGINGRFRLEGETEYIFFYHKASKQISKMRSIKQNGRTMNLLHLPLSIYTLSLLLQLQLLLSVVC